MSDAESLERVAETAHRLAVLLASGVAPAQAWSHLDIEGASALARAASEGASVPHTMLTLGSDDAWRSLAAAWAVAARAGAPLAPSLRAFAGSLRELAQSHRDRDVALAGPAATTRLVLALPLIGLVFGLALGFDTVSVLFGTLGGVLCLAAGAGLLLAARAWNRRMLRAAAPATTDPGLRLDLIAIAVSGGASHDRALASVESALAECGVSADGDDAVSEVLELAGRAGIPAAELLRAEAHERRRRARSDGQRAAARLAVTLLLPLGVCVLPAFMLLGVAPLVIAVVSSTVSGF